MKVKLQNEWKSLYTIEDLKRAKAIIKSEKEDDNETAAEWAEYAVNEALKDKSDYLLRIIEAKAETARNCRVWNAYSDESANMDIWIEATAKTTKGYIEIGAYLSDIWQSGAVEYRQHMYIQCYTRA